MDPKASVETGADRAPCPGCETEGSGRFVEPHHDRIGDKNYRIYRCGECGLVFSEPKEEVGAQWYEASAPIRGEEFADAAHEDWRFLQFLRDDLPPGSVADVGCGDGGFLKLLQDRGWSVSGVDYDARMIEIARGRGLKDVSSKPFEEFFAEKEGAAFDAATLFDVLEHTPEPARFLRKVRKLLKPGGFLAVTLPNAKRPLPWGREIHDFPPHHFTRWSPKAMRNFLEREGFEIVRQDAGSLSVYYLAENMFFSGLMPRLLPWVKRVLFGASAEDATVSELYGERDAEKKSSGLADKRTRHRLTTAFKWLMRIPIYPTACLMALYYRTTREDCGDCLYTLARLRG